MDNLNRIETEDIVIYKENVYSAETVKRCREIHRVLTLEGKIEGRFDDNKWMGYSGVRKFGINFDLNEKEYNSHIGKEFEIPLKNMQLMLKCYAIGCIGELVYSTIVREKISIIKEFLQRYRDNDFKLNASRISTIEDFLGFIDTPEEQIERIINGIKRVKSAESKSRQLAHIMNYLVIGNEVNRLFEGEIDEEQFIKWFPLYFWANITFVLPLRATEMLVTPLNCIVREKEKVSLKFRRTKLKKKTRAVYYEVEKDYKEFKFEIPDSNIVRTIEKYISLTSDQNRRFLFQYSETMVNKMVSLHSFNVLIAEFVEEHIVGNKRYDFARYAAGIKEFEVVTAGDSRPIAMASAYFQNAGEDICRQLADHAHIDTSAGYYSNVSETIWASSILHLQRKLDDESRYTSRQYEKSKSVVTEMEKSICMSKKRIEDPENLEDCVEQGHLEDCFGCKFYRPSKAELDAFLERQKKKTDESTLRVIEFFNKAMTLKGSESSLEELFLMVQTDATRYRMGCDIKAKEMLEEWENNRNIQRNSY